VSPKTCFYVSARAHVSSSSLQLVIRSLRLPQAIDSQLQNSFDRIRDLSLEVGVAETAANTNGFAGQPNKKYFKFSCAPPKVVAIETAPSPAPLSPLNYTGICLQVVCFARHTEQRNTSHASHVTRHASHYMSHVTLLTRASGIIGIRPFPKAHRSKPWQCRPAPALRWPFCTQLMAAACVILSPSLRVHTRHTSHVTRHASRFMLHASCVMRHASCVTPCTAHASHHTSHVTRRTSHVRCFASHVTRHTSHVTRHTSHVTRHTSHVTRHTSHVTRHTSHVTRHTSHVTRHTSHVTRHTSYVTSFCSGARPDRVQYTFCRSRAPRRRSIAQSE